MTIAHRPAGSKAHVVPRPPVCRFPRPILLLLLIGFCAAAQAGDLIISEFMADNQDTLLDGNGHASDWIELYNPGSDPVDIGGWSLSDDPLAPRKYVLPPRSIPSGGFLVVFASGTGVVDPAGYIHLNFQLSASGGYLGLYRPDGTVASAFADSYPAQRTDISYGPSEREVTLTLLASGSRGRALIPASAAGTGAWTGGSEPFNDASWLSVTNPIGYDSPAATASSLVNVALGRPVTVAADTWPGLPKENLTDGNASTFTHNNVQVPDFWFLVDLGATYKLENIELLNRADGCCPERLSDYTVSLLADAGADPGPVVWSASFRTNNSYSAVGGKDVITATNDASGLFAGRWIRVAARPDAGARYFQIAELRANAANWARGATVVASGATIAGYPASNLVDGNAATFSHNQDPAAAFAFQVKLPQSVSLTRIELVNRNDGCCPDRLTNYRVSIHPDAGGSPGPEAWGADVRTDGSNSGAGGVDVITADLSPAGSFEGQWIQIRNRDLGLNRYLQLAEVRAFGFAGGSGYGTLIRRDVSAEMRGINASAWVRLPFAATNVTTIGFLTLRVRYDDGFVAYLNGTEVARANAPGGPPPFDAHATATHFAALPVDFPVAPALLHEGTNVLAVQGLNRSPTDPDFLLLPELIARTRIVGPPGYLLTATPGQLNSTNSVAGFVSSARFSPDRGFFDTPQQVVITSPTPGATLVYTTNASIPSLTNGIVLTPPDDATSLSVTVRVATTTILRAGTFKTGLQSPHIDTHTYLFLGDVVRQPSNPAGFPSTWNGFPADYAMDPRVVTNTAYRGEMIADMRSIPTLSLVLNPSDLFGPKDGIYTFPENVGDAWERAVSAELILPDGSTGFQEDCGIRVWGTGWRPHSSSPKHSLQLKFQDQYGVRKLHYPLFKDAAFDAFDNIVLRAQGSRSWCDFRQPDIEQTQYIHDAFARDSARDMGKTDGHATYVHLYLNGLYWGLYNPVEKTDEGFAESNLGGDKSEYDVITRRDTPEADAGDLVAWNAMMTIVNGGVATPEQYALLLQYLDVDDLIDYMMFNQYATNHDGPTFNGNNMRAIRHRAPDGRFRFFFWDMEYTMWYAQEDNLSVDLDQTPARLFQKLRANPEFRLRWADHARRHLMGEGALTPAASIARWSARAAEIHGAVVGESARWGDVRRPTQPYTRDVEWTAELRRLLDEFFPARTGILLDQYRAEGLYPSIEAPEFNHPPGDVEPGFAAGIDAVGGTVYYTVDGTDPRLPGGGISPSALSFVPTTELVGTSTVVRAFVPSGPQSAAGWTSAVFDDSGWLSGPNPAGFDLTPAPAASAVPLQNATADFSESGDNIGQVLDAKPTSSGWGLLQPDFVNKGRGAVAVFQTVSNLGGAEGTLLTFQLQHGAAGQGALGKFRLSVTRDDRGTFADGKPNHGDVTANWTPLQPLSATSSGGSTLRITPERAVLATGLNPSTDTYTVTALTPWSDITGFRIEALEDSALPNRGPGRNSSGDALLTDFSIRAAPATLQPVLKTPFSGLAAAVHGVNASVYLRYPFTLQNSPAFQHLILRVRYDDGFVAYLNGHEVARRNAPDALDWNSAASTDRRLGAALEFEEIDLSAGLPWLQAGANVLAVQAMTHSGDAPDLLFESQLIAKTDVAIPVSDALTLRARAFDARGWSALNEALFTVSAPLRITEIMHHPPDATVNDGDDYQFVEIQNVGAAPYPLGGLGFTSGIKYIFPAGSSLGAGQFLVLARNPARFAARYPGVPVAGAFTGKLSHSGDTLVISRLQGGQVVLRVQYSDSFPWPPAADGLGFSLVPRDPQAVPAVGDGTAWRASAAPLGSPGGPDPQPTIPPLLVNEVLSAAVPPQVDTIELANPTAQPVSVDGWFLTDDRKQPFKFRIVDPTPIPAHGFRLITATEYGPPATPAGFELSGSGDSVYLFSGDAATNLTGYAHGFSFGASARGVSFGRYVTSVGEEVFPAQSSLTLPGPNAGPRIGPVVLSEIHYHPPAGQDPFVELKNISDSPVPLFDPAHPENTWRISGMGFSFPPALTLAPGGRLLVVAADPEAYRQRHAIDPGVIILGPYAGQLQASGERLELQQPGDPVASGVPMITLDEVRYNDHAPWPREADGFGASLQRVLPPSYGNDPTAWVAARPGPGTDYLPSAGPRITQQPASVSVAKGDVAQLSVGASGPDDLSFQWRFQGSAVDGGTGPILILPNVQPSQAGFYEVTVFNAGGAVTSARALLSVLVPPSITSQPAGRTVAAGSNVLFSVTAAGTGSLHYQWRRNGSDLPGATGPSLSLQAVSVDQSGDYRVLITDDVGSVLSQAASLVVLVKPAILAGPLDQSAVPGQLVSFVATVTGTPPLYYRWRLNGVVLLTQVQEAPISVLTLTNFQASQAGTLSFSVSNALAGSLVTATATLAAAADADGDGMADAWEKLTGLDPANRADALADPDGDGMSNLAEYIAGTNPRDGLSVLRLQALPAPGSGVTLSFPAVSNHTYTVQYSGTLPASAWIRLQDLPASPVSGVRTLLDTAVPTNRYYRVVVPAQP